ncbi:MAG: hypothetical protein MOIL_01500 [Candidatus Methanolliviera sp. GoM_oil]|nr:MAG: hypothetical protein MOIL_01500 [Candidatus Methanolliviera sp. GoM_oil]
MKFEEAKQKEIGWGSRTRDLIGIRRDKISGRYDRRWKR